MENRDMNLFDFLILCWKAMWRFLSRVGLFLLYTVRFGLRYSWIIIPFAVMGLLAGWVWIKPIATTYKCNATVLYAEGMREVVQESVIDFLNLPYKEKIEWGVDSVVLDRLDRFYMYNVVDCNADSVPDFVDKNRRISISDTTHLVMRDRVHFELILSGTDKSGSFQTALTDFICSQPYVVEADKHCRKIREERLAYFTRELARLDSFSTYAYFNRPQSSRVEVVNAEKYSSENKDLYYIDMMKVLKNKNHIERQILSTPNVINFQTPFVAYAMPPIYKYAIGFVVGTILGFALALCIKYREIIWAFLKEK